MSYHRFNDDYGSFEVFLHADGFYWWWSCFPASLPDGDAIGPFDTYSEAFDDALMNYE